MQDFWQVQEGEEGEVIELPSESDGTLLLTTLSAQFPGASGLKYKSEDSGAYRGIRLADGKLHPPEGSITSYTFIVVFPKAEVKRKMDDESDSPVSKKRDSRFKCSDLIVLGLPFKTEEDTVREYFSTYGELLLVQVKKNAQTGRSKGFGFIRFANIEAQAKVICSRHLIDGRWCEVKIANAKNGDPTLTTTKIFVGRLTEDITTNDLNDYFSKYGQVLDVYIPKPFRGFAFVNFADPFVAYTLCAEADDHIIKQVSVHVSKASPRGENKVSKIGIDHSNYGYGKGSALYQPNSGPGYSGGSSNSGGSNYGSGNSYSGSGGGFGGDSFRNSNQNEFRGSSGRMGPGNNGPPNNNNSNSGDLTNLSALTPALIAAALNQAGLGNLLSSLQQSGKTEPPPPPPPSRGFSDQPPTSRSSNWDVPTSSNWMKKDSSNNYSNY